MVKARDLVAIKVLKNLLRSSIILYGSVFLL